MSTVKRVFGYYRTHLLKLFLAFLGLTCLTVLGLLRPKLIGILIDDVIYGGNIDLLLQLVLAFVGIALGRGVFRMIWVYFSEKLALSAIADIRTELFKHLTVLPYSFYDKARTGDLMSRISSDVESLKHLLADFLLEMYDALLTMGFVFVMLLRINVQLTILSLITVPLLFYATYLFAQRIHPAFLKIQEQMASMTNMVQENITGVRVVKAFNQQMAEKEKFRGENQAYLDSMMVSVRIRAKFGPMIELLGTFSALVVLVLGGQLVINKAISMGQLVEFHTYIGHLYWPIRSLVMLVSFYQRAKASGDRVFELMDTPVELKDYPDAEEMEIKGEIEFKNVTFAYDEEPVLQNISLNIPRGSTIGIIGETGSGKTSLINLIGRFYDYQEGQILIDGVDIRKIKLQSLRRAIGIVHQDIFLFSDAIENNILFGNEQAHNEEMINFAKVARADEFIMDMNDGYSTLIGERGVGLSGGQRQRIAIARSLVRKPSILILDDATSSVDMETEFLIRQQMEPLLDDCTTIIIAHRISSVEKADRIYVMHDGQIAEEGTHAELLAKQGIYRNIFNEQYREQEKLQLFMQQEVTA